MYPWINILNKEKVSRIEKLSIYSKFEKCTYIWTYVAYAGSFEVA